MTAARHHHILIGLFIIISVLFFPDITDMFGIWWNSSTFNHCLLLLPILAWLYHQRRDDLAKISPKFGWISLPYITLAGAIWLIGDAADLAIARQLSVIMMFQGAVILAWGVERGLALSFPIFYAFFLLPFGEEFVGPLQIITADICMFLLNLFGIPAHLDGIYISTTFGLFRVAEACSGVKFLVAMIAYGALVGNLCFFSWFRRAAFMVAAIIISILANGVRAWGTIIIAKYWGAEAATGMDHLIFGWVFFAIIIGILMAVSWKFFDRKVDDPLVNHGRVAKYAAYLHWPKLSPITGAILTSIILMTPISWSYFSGQRMSETPATIILPEIIGWTRSNAAMEQPWSPIYHAPSHRLDGRYVDEKGNVADLTIIVYDKQAEDRELIAFGQGAIGENSIWSWVGTPSYPFDAKAERIISQSADWPSARQIITFYHVNGVTSGNILQIKLATMKARLFAGNEQAVAIIISVEEKAGRDNKLILQKFVKALGPIDKLAMQMAGTG
ncbi:EpsI family protein [Sphingorhabdus lutea]|uniref:EpsI family protein n=1 Tax=Sphingorhabdus lutea TaxID=1913578 RepID=A0A1L3JBD7_9SPHN|nr:EpsI domain-containing exosortase [Sphingorhabdus lutea]APG62457.1 EpsI family protein [Sphingorhabdus lutea]